MPDSIHELAGEIQSANMFNINNSSKTSVNSRNSRIISCRICLSNILDPASLTCGHKFCEGCLNKYWDAKDRPTFIVCPLCRTMAYNVDFAEKAPPSTADFRKTFNLLGDIPETQVSSSALSCFKFSMILPAIYYLLKWLGLPLMGLFT